MGVSTSNPMISDESVTVIVFPDAEILDITELSPVEPTILYSSTFGSISKEALG